MFLDIETIPCDDDTKEIFFYHKLKEKSIDMSEDKLDELHSTSSFDGTFGRICCIAYILENGKVEKGILKGEEKEILKEFWKIAGEADLFIGHNIFEFDLPFILRRSIIHGIKPTQNINFRKFYNSPIFDTMCFWANWSYEPGKKVRLDTLAKVFGFPTSKDEMDGSMVWPYYKDGKVDEICKYCMKDVELTRKIYYKLVIETPPDDNLMEDFT